MPESRTGVEKYCDHAQRQAAEWPTADRAVGREVNRRQVHSQVDGLGRSPTRTGRTQQTRPADDCFAGPCSCIRKHSAIVTKPRVGVVLKSNASIESRMTGHQRRGIGGFHHRVGSKRSPECTSITIVPEFLTPFFGASITATAPPQTHSSVHQRRMNEPN